MSGKIWKSGYEEIMETLVASNECVYKGSFIELPFLKIVTWVCFNLSLSLSLSLRKSIFSKRKGEFLQNIQYPLSEDRRFSQNSINQEESRLQKFILSLSRIKSALQLDKLIKFYIDSCKGQFYGQYLIL